jgi:hypothetical protein
MRTITAGDGMRALSMLVTVIMAIALTALLGCRPNTPVATSSSCPTEPLEDARFGVRYLPCQVTNLPVLQIDTANWHYPDMMRGAGVSGRVRVAFIVDTAGRYVPGSMQVISSTNAQFSNAVKIALSRGHFSRGRRGVSAVAVGLVADVVFTLPKGVDIREMGGLGAIVTLASNASLDSIPGIEVRLDAEDPSLGPPPNRVLRDSLAHEAIRLIARELGWSDDSPSAPSGTPLLLCVQGDTSLFESGADRALAPTMTRPHVRVLTMRGCPPTRVRMFALPPGMEPRYPPDSVPFIEPHRLRVARVALRIGGGPQVDLVDEHMLGEQEYRCIRVPRASSIFELRCVPGRSITH